MDQNTRNVERDAERKGVQTEEAPVSLFQADEGRGFRTRWDAIQGGFVDEPRAAVEQADALVAEMMKRLSDVFADQRGRLEAKWSQGHDASTEDLRVLLRSYRSF